MKSLLSLVVALAIAGGIYFYYFKKMPVSDSGTASTQAISLTGVRMDLNQIAQAERTYFATNAKCVSLEELSTSGTINFHDKLSTIDAGERAAREDANAARFVSVEERDESSE